MATNQSRTFDTLITAVQQLGFPDPDSGITIGSFINEAYKRVAGERRWEWLQGTFTFPIVAGTFSYAESVVSPGDIRNMDALWVVDAQDNQYQVRYAHPLQLLDWNQDQTAATTGAPRYWSVWGGNILLYPTPDQAYTATVAYTKSLGDTPLTFGQRPLLPGDYDTILVYAAAALMAARLKDWLGRDFFNQERDQALGAMRSDYQLKQRQTPDEVEYTGIWGPSDKAWQNEPGWW